jgi:multiple antibiotic resistance protein
VPRTLGAEMSLVSYVTLSLGSLVSIVDPLTVVPIFLVLVGAQPRPLQVATAVRAAGTCFTVLAVFALAGNFVFSFFGITLPAFRVAGGILLFVVGLEMMRARRSETRGTAEEATEAEAKEAVGVIPLGVPCYPDRVPSPP